MEESNVSNSPVELNFARVGYALSGLSRDDSEEILKLVEFMGDQFREQEAKRQRTSTLKQPCLRRANGKTG